jgi:subtilisin-like proprotein convertase family protein
LNWVEPYEISGVRKTLFYTEVNTNFQVGDRVYIVNGNYDNDSLIKKDKYKKGRDGYKILKVEQCKVVLDIDYTGALPYKDDSLDDYIKVYYIDNPESFVNANRQVTTRGGTFSYKFNYYQNNIAFIDKNQGPIKDWGFNAGVSGTPGFFVREEEQGWSKISDELVYLGSFSVALSPTYKNNGRILIMDGSFTYNGIQFKEGFVYTWNVGPTSSSWQVDPSYSPAIITKSNFRNGTFNGKFNNGLYGTQQNKLSWSGKGTWNGGSMVNTLWKSGTIDSKIIFNNTYKAIFDEYGIPFQKSYTNNNGGFGYNYIFDSEVEKSLVNNGNFYNTSFNQIATGSVVENHVLSITQSFENRISKGYFDLCIFKNIQIDGGEIKNTRSINSKFSNVKSINSYFDKSVLKDSTYISDKIVKILGYDEWNMSEYRTAQSGKFSSIRDVNSKIYKFYISKESYKRLKTEDVFYIKGLKIKNSPTLTDFFDSKFRLTSWTEFYNDLNYTIPKSISGVDIYSFYKRGYECSAFLSTPEENAYIINSSETLYNVAGATASRYTTLLSGVNKNAAYSIDIIVSRHDIFNKNQSIDTTSEWDAPNPINYNYSSDVIVGTTSLPQFLGSNIDISNAYILDSDFNSGIIETSDWNSGYHINYNNDVVITSVTSSGIYNLEIDDNKDYLIAHTNLNFLYPEKIGKSVIEKDDIIFLNSVDYDTRGMVTKVTLLTQGSSYSTTSDPIFLTNTKVSSLTMSNVGTYYKTESGLATYNTNGVGTGLTVDITAKNIGSVTGITYSGPLSGGGSYSMTFVNLIPDAAGPIGTSFSAGASPSAILPASYVSTGILVDTNGSITGVPGATYSNFGPPLVSVPSGATGVGAIFFTGPIVTLPNGSTASPNTLGSGLTVNYRTSANGTITYLEINNSGLRYDVNQVFKIEGGNATFSIKTVGNGEITSFNINTPGEDYLIGDVLNIINPFDPNSQFVGGLTASITVTSITASNKDTRGLSLNLFTGIGATEGKIEDITINGAGLYYNEGEIFTISDVDSNLDALVRIDSVTGSVTRLNDTYKVIENDKGRLTLRDLGTTNIVAGLTANGLFYTTDAKNRWGYISKTKIDKTKIKSGIFKRPYIVNSLIRDIDYDSTDKDFNNIDKVKNLIISDTLFSNNSNILSSATYLYSNLVGGTDIWNDGIINKSIINGLTFSKGTIKQATWITGNFTGGMFYNSKSFDAKPTLDRPNYLNDRVRSYYMIGNIGATLSNNRYSWRNGKFSGGQFYKSDWENGVMDNGLFFYSKFYAGTINGGKIGTKQVAAADTKIYNGLINYTTVDNANVYSEDTSYTGLSSSSIEWMNGVFNNGIFGSNNDDVLGTTFSNISYNLDLQSLAIADYKITIATQSINDINPILGDFEIDLNLTIKHTYLGDLIINLMSPNGRIINIKKRYSCGGNDNLLSTNFTSDSTKPNLEIGTPPYTGEFKFDALINQGVYYDLNNRLLPNIAYNATENIIPTVIDYRSQPPANVYESDRYLVIATASDPNWVAPAAGTAEVWPVSFVGKIVERSTSSDPLYAWELYFVKNNDKLFVKNKSEYLKYIVSSSFTGWTKSYHSNATKISELLNTDKSVKGIWTLMVMDCAAVDSGFVEKFNLTFNYKTSYIIKSFKNDAVWHDGIFNGGQFIDLGVWKNGKFNGGKFISTYGYKKSGSYLVPNENILDYSWHAGEFNGGEFGNESLLSNSTWFNGVFNDGVFKGKLWNNGVFTYGEFKGGSSVPAAGNGIKSVNAQLFIDSFKTEYYGVWRSGVVSDKKDNFVTDKKLFTTPVRAMAPVKLGKSAKFSNMLWLSGTFDHPSGEINNSVWLNGLFKMGSFKSSAFNPYVTRKSDRPEFIKDDSCIWENGKLIDSEFHMSKWKYGQFISGTAVGMIWQNGISNYMNAYNIFWENGVWRNGNWYGSNFEYRGRVDDGFSKEILNRGIEWSGTSSCHIWNIFESDVDTTVSMVETRILKPNIDSFTTTNQDDAGIFPPAIDIVYVEKIGSPTKVKATFNIINNNGAPIGEAGVIFVESASESDANNAFPSLSVTGGIATPAAGTKPKQSTVLSATTTPIFTTGDANTGFLITFEITVTGLIASKWYSLRGYAINSASSVDGPAITTNTVVFQTVQKNEPITVNALPVPSATTEVYTGAFQGPAVASSYTQTIKSSITITANYTFVAGSQPAPTEKGLLYTTSSSAVLEYSSVGGGNVFNKTNASTGNTFTTTLLTTGFNAIVANTTYYIRPYTSNTGGYGYGPIITVTSGVDVPVVTQVTPTTTILKGSLTSTGGSTTLEKGFIISIDAAATNVTPTTYATTYTSNQIRVVVATDGTTGDFTQTIANIVGIASNTSYRVRAYAYSTTQPSVYAYSSEKPFFSAPGAVDVTTTLPLLISSNITENGATLKGDIVNINGSPIVANGTGFVYTTTGTGYPTGTTAPTTMPQPNTNTLGYFAFTDTIGNFSYTVTTFDSGQKYFFKAYATNGIGTGYGLEYSITTLAKITTTLISTATTITPTIAITSAINSGAAAPTARGIIWNTSYFTPATAATLLTTRTADTAAPPTSATGLTPNTKYFLRGYVTNISGTYYEEVVEKITLPAFEPTTITEVTESAESVIINTNAAGVGGIGNVLLGTAALLTEKGIAYSTLPNSATPTTIASATAINKLNYTTNINSLIIGQKYYYRPYAKNAAGTGYLGTTDLEFTTLVKVTLPTPEGNDVTYDSSNKKMIIGTTGNPITITNNGSSTILSYGLCFTTDGSNPTDQNPSLPATGTTANATSFFDSISVVTPASGQTTTYKVRAYVTNDGGTAYSRMITFTINASNNITSGPSFTT